MLKQRTLTALIGIPLLVIAVWFDAPLPWFTLLVAACGGIATFEFYRLVRMVKAAPLAYFGILLSVLLIVSRDPALLSFVSPSVWFALPASRFDVNLLGPLLLTSAITISLFSLLARVPRDQAFHGWAWTMAGVLYTGWLLGYLVALRGVADGRNWVFLALFTTFASDTAAFFIGRRWGKHRMAPAISPGKTWEGAVAGALGAVAMSVFFALPTPLGLDLTFPQAGSLGLLVSVFGQMGDLVESLFKRNMGVKDSGRLLPGHGGVLDRTDSIAFAGIVVYYYVLWVAL
ncbi:MAG: phosphatidate cytidylyltransferase [Chloroflexi bacterium]|nr:phosphatidate cytidylyltransferase [Chloroflexota bacterium]